MLKLQAFLKFESQEDCDSFIKLMRRIPFRENWDDIKKFKSNTSCHVCDSKNNVKQGIVPVNDFFESTRIEAYTFWNLCHDCHEKGWHVPHDFFPNSVLEYWFIDNKTCKFRTFHKHDIRIFQRPQLTCLNTDGLFISVEPDKPLFQEPR